MNLAEIKNLGAIKSDENLKILLELYDKISDIELRREIVSSIGRQKNNAAILKFIRENVYSCGFMELVYQMYRTCLYKGKFDKSFEILGEEIKNFFNNEVLNKMYDFYQYRQLKKSKKPRPAKFEKPLLLQGNNVEALKKLAANSVQLIFTSPPYYNAKIYSDYHSFSDGLPQSFGGRKIYNRQCFAGNFQASGQGI